MVDNRTSEKTEWLKSPVTAKHERMRLGQSISLQPYFGQRKKIRFSHTSYLIGSGDGCDIKISDPFLSTHHAKITLKAGNDGYELEDLDSKNGVFLNGLRVTKAFLPKQGVIRLGRSTLSWRDEAEFSWVNSEEWICEDPFFRETLERLQAIAQSNLPILLLGETGTGKDVIANYIHRSSSRNQNALVVINSACAGGTLVDSELFGHSKGAYTGSDSKRLGAIMSANRGTLFLDEIADLPLESQVKLLRTLECGEVKALGSDLLEQSDFRLISATSQNIDSRIESGIFRLDLYYRIAGYVVHVPPLRERPRDILAITKKFLNKKGLSLSKECEGLLLSYSWPGNVRELKSTVERAIVLAGAAGISEVQNDHFLFPMIRKKIQSTRAESARPTLEAAEQEIIRATLLETGWSRSSTAKALGIARSTLFEKMRRYGITDSVDH